MLSLLDDYLIPGANSANEEEAKVFYYKMKGDYYRYLAEVSNPDEKEKITTEAQNAYNQATTDSE